MYKYLIIGIALMFVTGSGYYLNKSGGLNLIYKASKSSGPLNLTQLTRDEISGLYVCNESSGCVHKHLLLLQDDLTAEMLILTKIDKETEDGNTEIDELLQDTTQITTQTEVKSQEPQQDTQTTLYTGSSTNAFTESSSSTLTTESTTLATIDSDKSTINENTDNSESKTTANNYEDLPYSTENNEQRSDTIQNLFAAIQEKNPESTLEKGTWDLDVQNMLVIKIETSATSTLEVPRKFVIKSVDTKTLSNINYTKKVYISMRDPVFKKRN
jgi:hypothetical protein